MKVSTILDNLMASEIFTFDIKPDGVFQDEKKRRVLTLINLGLQNLYQRFTIKESTLLLNVEGSKQIYNLITANALSTNSLGYILDSEEIPFTGDILEVIRIIDPNGKLLLGNVEQASTSNPFNDGIYTNANISHINSNVSVSLGSRLTFNGDVKEGVYRIIYRADAPLIDLDSDTLLDDYVELPTLYLNALCCFVASKMYNPMGAETIGRSMFHEGNNWTSKYEEECKRIRDQFAGDKSLIAVSNFQRGGWA